MKVLPKMGKDQAMNAAAEMVDGARSKVAHLVWCRQVVTGSRRRAEAEVGQMIGRSDSWIRKLLGRTLDTKRPDAVVLQNIHAVYARTRAIYGNVCAGIETAADARLQHALELLDKTNAATAGDQTMDQGMVGGMSMAVEVGPDGSQRPAEDPMEFPPFLVRSK